MRRLHRRGPSVLVMLAAATALLAGCSSHPLPPKAAAPARSGGHGSAAPVTTTTQPPLPPGTVRLSGFYGVNFDLAGFEPFAKADTAALLAALGPSTIRWPGGTEADFYDWRSGQDTHKPGRAPFSLEDLAAACRAAGAVPIFDLNVLAPGNQRDPSDQIAMLEEARALGLPVDYVEIGNELYSNAPGAPQAFPDGSAYARTVAIYVEALHEAFPGVKVAADAIPFPEDAREQSWDAELLAGATGTGAPDALVVHFYPGLYQSPFVASDLPALFENLYSSLSELSQATKGLGGKPVWLTEYNFRGPYRAFRLEGPPPAEGDYAHELYLAAFAAMLPRVTGLALVDNWTALADGFYGAWQDPSSPHLSPGGQAVEMVDRAAKGASAAEVLPVPGAPELPGGEPGVVGERFVRPGGASSAVLVNLTPDPVTLPAQAWLPPGTPYAQVTGDPTAPEAVASSPASGIAGPSGVGLAPWSVTVIGAALATPTGP